MYALDISYFIIIGESWMLAKFQNTELGILRRKSDSLREVYLTPREKFRDDIYLNLKKKIAEFEMSI